MWNLISQQVLHTILVEAQDAQSGAWTALPGSPKTMYCSDHSEPPGPLTGVATPLPGRVWKQYYYADQRLVAVRTQGDPSQSTNTVYYLHSDHLGSASLTTDSAGAPYTRQSYDPYGQPRSTPSPSMPTDIGFTGQRLDASGLMYYGARYYSAVIGRFVSADTIVPEPGNPQSLNRYSYTENNPLKYTDPTGHTLACGAGDGDANCGTYYAGYSVLDPRPEVQAYLTDTMDTRHMLDPILGWVASGLLGGLVADVVGVALPILNPVPAQVQETSQVDVGDPDPGPALEQATSAQPCSFSADTLVATANGEQPIGTLQVGDQVLAYNPAVNVTGWYPITAVLVHLDFAVEFLIIEGEQVETTPEHPFYTLEAGWQHAGDLQIGEHIRRANGGYGEVQAVEVVQQPQVMYNLTVAQAHTFFVGQKQWLVHNTCRWLPGASSSTRSVGEDLAGKAKGYYGLLREANISTKDVTVAVSNVEINGARVEVVTANGRASQAAANALQIAVEGQGGIFSQAPGQMHAEEWLYRQYGGMDGFSAIGVSNYKGPCPGCQRFFGRVGFSNVYWDPTFVP